jgi:hypothetical protein
MESTSRNWQYFDPGIKHQLFESFRRYKTNNSVSKNNNALVISSVEQQILQGIPIDNNSILEINKVLLKYLQNNTLYNKFDESYMINNPYGFFQEGLNLFFKDYNPSDSYSYEGEIYICKLNDKIYITPDDAYGYQPYVFELCMIHDTKDYKPYNDLVINIFALIYKTGMFSYYTDTKVFDLIESEYYVNEKGKPEAVMDDVDEEDLVEVIKTIENYKTGYYRELMDIVINFSEKNSSETIKVNLLSLIDETDETNLFINDLISILDNINWKHVKEFVEFQHLSYDILDDEKQKYQDRYSHIMNYNKFEYDVEGNLEQSFNSFDESDLNESFYQPYLIPFCFSKDGKSIDYGNVLDNLMNLFNLVLQIERYIYAQTINKGTE